MIPETKIEHVATQTSHSSRPIGAVRSVETNQADDASCGVLNEVVEQETTEETSRAGQEDGLGLAERSGVYLSFR